MSIATFNKDKWVLSINEEATRNYCVCTTANPEYAYRRYIEFCRKLSKTEWCFFEKLCLNPEKCLLTSVPSFETRDPMPVSGTYIVSGQLLRYPSEDVITADELKARNFHYSFKDNKIYIDRFIFDIQCPAYLINTIPKDWPNEYIRIDFFCNIPNKPIDT